MCRCLNICTKIIHFLFPSKKISLYLLLDFSLSVPSPHRLLSIHGHEGIGNIVINYIKIKKNELLNYGGQTDCTHYKEKVAS